ncbi:hypothetical protein [Pontibacillus halophilus]|uniref:hypothetical protein n=1 Tax=Pontibacillus halophilus TaxID=516704 RepID=UPI000421A98D|nr:hypothetical protein [Pontibacillus halophilus]
MSKRITTVSKKQLLNDNMEEAGLAVRMSDLLSNTRLKSDDEELSSKLVSTVKRKMKKLIVKMDMEQLKEFTEEISFGPSKISITEDMSEGKYNDIPKIQLITACANKLKTLDIPHAKELANEYLPMEICYEDKKGREFTGLSLLLAPINAKKHGNLRFLRNVGYESRRVFDLATLLTTVFLDNSLVKFVAANVETIQYLLVKKLLRKQSSMATTDDGNVLYIPSSEDFAKDFLYYVEKYNLSTYENSVKAKWLDSYEKNFYMEDEISYHIDSPVLKDIVISEFIHQYEHVKQKTEKQLESRTDYARSFQTKKQISNKHKTAMTNNAFKSKYSYVELDNEVLFRSDLYDTDLTEEERTSIYTFEDLEDEFKKLSREVFIPYSEGSFRIKRLGNLKAAGVFYPHANATIIDREHPDSFCHELGHQLDYTISESSHSTVSEALEFRPIIEMYSRKVQQTVDDLPAGSDFKELWNGKTKFNASYFLQPTEVFARSYELYLWHKGIRSSFMKSAYSGPEYPNHDEYIARISLYFDNLFARVENSFPTVKERKLRPAASPSVNIREEDLVYEMGEEGQMSLF